jgi:hypothetical protein
MMSDDFSEDPKDPYFGQRCFGLLFSVWRSPQWISDLSDSIEEKIGGALLCGDGPLQIIREGKQPICMIYLGSRVIGVAKLLGVEVNSATKYVPAEGTLQMPCCLVLGSFDCQILREIKLAFPHAFRDNPNWRRIRFKQTSDST